MEHMAEVELEYDRLLGLHRRELGDYLESQRPLLKRHGLAGAGYQLPLRPMFFSPAGLRRVESCVEVLFGALLKTFHVHLGGDVGRAAELLQLADPVRECLQECFRPELEVKQLFGRPDGFAWGAQVRFIEQNVTSGPGGLAAVDALARFWDGSPAIRALRAQVPVDPLSPMDAYAALFASPRYAGKTIGYLDALDPATGKLWDDDGLRFLDVLEERGHHLINLTGRELSLRGDGVYAEGRRLDLVYRGVAALGLWFRMEELRPIFQACGRGQVEMLISPFEMIFFDKMLLPYLSDEALNGFLPAEDRRVLAEIIPWTRFLKDYATRHGGRTVSIPEYCLQHRPRLVIKKGNGFGSEAVVLGAEQTDAAWGDAVARGMKEGNWIVQELVDPPRVRLPYLDGGGELIWAEVLCMACPYVVTGQVSGFGGRTSVPDGGRILVGAGGEGSRAGIRTAFRVG